MSSPSAIFWSDLDRARGNRVYNVSFSNHERTGTMPVPAQSRREAVSIVKGRLGPETEAVVTGVRP